MSAVVPVVPWSIARTCFIAVSIRRAGKKTPSPRETAGSPIRPAVCPPRKAVLSARLTAPLRKVLVKKIDQSALLRCVTKSIVRVSEMSGQRDSSTAAKILHHHDRVHVRLPTDGRRVAQLGSYESHRGNDVLLALVLALSLPQLGEHRRCTQRSTPGAEILGGV